MRPQVIELRHCSPPGTHCMVRPERVLHHRALGDCQPTPGATAVTKQLGDRWQVLQLQVRH